MNPEYYLRLLQKFPHRGVGTKFEKEAAKVIYNEYYKGGLNPKIHFFNVNRNGWEIYSLFFAFFIASSVFMLLGFNWLGLLLFLPATILYFNIGINTNWLFKNFLRVQSQNVYVEFLPKDKKYTNTIVAIGHYDTARRTIALKVINKMFSTGIVLVDKTMPNFLRGPFLMTNIATVMIPLLLISGLNPTLRAVVAFYILFTFTVTEVLVLIMSMSPRVPGAFDNGSGTSVVMSLTDYFQKNVLKHSRLILLNNGSEENYTNGLPEFKREANINVDSTYFINMDGVGADILLAAYGETDRTGLSLYYDKKLYGKVLETIKSDSRYLGIKEYYIPTPTDGMKLMDEECKVVVTMCSIGRDGHLGHYHQTDDTIDKINFETLNLCRDFVVDLIKRLDRDHLPK